VRTKSLDFVNAPPHVSVVLSIFRQFMKQKLRERVSTKFYNNIILLPWCWCIPYILQFNPHSVFGDFLNGKKLICDSNPHPSFNHPLPTGQLIE
jgi:hypothetical protein